MNILGIRGADPAHVSGKAMERGSGQIGTLGSGNHYLEVQVSRPEDVIDAELARGFGLGLPEQVVVMFHCGSRGFGHQVATEYLRTFLDAMPRFGIPVIDHIVVAGDRSLSIQEWRSGNKW